MSNNPRILWGPFTATPHEVFDVNNSWKVDPTTFVEPVLRWHFNGIRADHSVGHYHLTFDIKKRKFRATTLPISNNLPPAFVKRLTRDHAIRISKETVDPAVNATMFIGAEVPEPIPGLLRDILKSMLSEADIARCVALSATWQR